MEFFLLSIRRLIFRRSVLSCRKNGYARFMRKIIFAGTAGLVVVAIWRLALFAYPPGSMEWFIEQQKWTFFLFCASVVIFIAGILMAMLKSLDSPELAKEFTHGPYEDVSSNCIDPALGAMLSRYLEKKLSAGERTTFELHMSRCDSCRHNFDVDHHLAIFIAGREKIF